MKGWVLMPITIKDIARKTKVAANTIPKVLNNRSKTGYKEVTSDEKVVQCCSLASIPMQ